MAIDYDTFVNFSWCRGHGRFDCNECLLRFVCCTSVNQAHELAAKTWVETRNKIETIKIYRNSRKSAGIDTGLKEAKDYVEERIIPFY